MLRAYANMPASEFISQLRTYVIALGLSPQVVDCVDDLAGINELEDQHAAELEKAEECGRQNMKDEILSAANQWLENCPDYDLIAAPCEALIKKIEEVEV